MGNHGQISFLLQLSCTASRETSWQGVTVDYIALNSATELLTAAVAGITNTVCFLNEQAFTWMATVEVKVVFFRIPIS